MDKIENKYRDAVRILREEKHFYEAADNLERFLNSNSSDKEFSLDWLKRFNTFKDAQKRLEDHLRKAVEQETKQVSQLSNQLKTFTSRPNYASLTGWGGSLIGLEEELVATVGSSQIQGVANVTIRQSDDPNQRNTYTFYGDGEFYWFDEYNWNQGGFTPYFSFFKWPTIYRDNDAIALVKSNRASNFHRRVGK